jgi:S1-C subfamily serine protease
VLSAQNQIDPAKAAYQTDAWINQANQGGALIDMNGRLLGISLLYAPSRYGLNSGVGFAIPIWSIRRVIDRLKQGQDVHPGYLGVRLAPVYEPENRGVRVVKVVRHSPAQRGGLQPGDRILAVNGRPTQDMIDVLVQLAGIIEGERVELEIVRNGAPRILTIVAERRG